ncbi:hypothetical protein BV133_1057 [Blastochloris viridis]|uniref:Uncharacterized protein n=1 Tax=Blastochloris viridis TaxID=1079 RepID=A0A182CZK5_BLAVI|nr:hypothetical protein BV133_1057 [Blastochloris viridis]
MCRPGLTSGAPGFEPRRPRAIFRREHPGDEDRAPPTRAG